MRVLDSTAAASELAKALNKPVLYLSMVGANFNFEDFDKDGRFLPAPFLTTMTHGQVLADEHTFIVCDSEEEMEDLFWQTVGDDGPTPTNSYNGPCRVYALTINAKGEMRNENT
jgi:hypothetical protein